MSTIPGIAGSGAWTAAAAAGGFDKIVTVPTGQDFSLHDALGNPTGVVRYYLIVPPTTIATSSNANIPAIDCSTGMHTGSSGVWLVMGRVCGAGGVGTKGTDWQAHEPYVTGSYLMTVNGVGGAGGGAGASPGTGGTSTGDGGPGLVGDDANEAVGSNPPASYVGGAGGTSTFFGFGSWDDPSTLSIGPYPTHPGWDGTEAPHNYYQKGQNGGDAFWVNHTVTAFNAGSEIWGGGGSGAPGFSCSNRYVPDGSPDREAFRHGGAGGAIGQDGSKGAYYSTPDPNPWLGDLTYGADPNGPASYDAGSGDFTAPYLNSEPGLSGYAIRLHDSAPTPTLIAGTASPLTEGNIG